MKGKSSKTEAYMNYIEIFGERGKGPPNEELSHQVLRDYVTEFPEIPDQATSNVSKPRGVADLSRYVHRRGSRTSQDAVQRWPKLDYELFKNKMKMVRAWPEQRCKDEWLKLEANADIARDQGGYGQFKLRLSIPPRSWARTSTSSGQGPSRRRPWKARRSPRSSVARTRRLAGSDSHGVRKLPADDRQGPQQHLHAFICIFLRL